MSFNYKNPITPLSTLGNISVQRQNVFGTNFSILSTGGYMEVYNLNELYYTIPPSTTGLIEFSGNTIPIQLNKGTGSSFSFDVLTLNSDNISSGRRRLGMLVYVIDQNQFYQFQIPNFITLWNSATGATGPGGQTVIFSDFGTTIKSNTPEGIAFISAWTSNVIEGVSGGTSTNSVWKKFLITDGVSYLPLSGGTVTGNTVFTSGLTANTFSASTYLGLPGDIFITGGSFNNNTDTLTLDRSSGSSITITGFTDYYTTGATLIGDVIYFNRNDILSAYTVNLSSFTPSVDVFVTGGTYSAGTATFTNNTGGTFNVLGFYTGNTDNNTFVTGFTYSSNTLTIFDNSGSTFPVTINQFTGLTINGSLSATTISGGTFYGNGSNLTGINFTGGTVSGNTTFLSGLTATTISATTYLNLPTDIYITGGTFNNNTDTLTLNRSSGSSITITGFTDYYTTGATLIGDVIYFDRNDTLSAYSVNLSAFTPSTDVYTTGFTYSSNTLTILDNSGNTFPVTINEFTGLTINGTLSATTISATTYLGLPLDVYVTGGTYSAGTTTFTNNTGGTFNVTGFSNFHYYISGSSPSGVTLSIGDRWYNTNNGAEYVWNYDGNTYQWVQPAGTPGPQGPQGVSGATGPQGVPGFSNLLVTTAITISAETLTTGYTYYGIVHSGIVNLTLPNPTGIDGFNLNIKDESGNAGIYRIRLTSPVGNIDNYNYVDMNINKMSLNLVARNNNWWLI